jgi:hypothetical protein
MKAGDVTIPCHRSGEVKALREYQTARAVQDHTREEQDEYGVNE